MAEGACVPALGLSNKAVFTASDTSEDSSTKDSELYFVPQHLTGFV